MPRMGLITLWQPPRTYLSVRKTAAPPRVARISRLCAGRRSHDFWQALFLHVLFGVTWEESPACSA